MLRRISLVTINFILRTSIFFGFTLLAVVLVFGNRQTLKTTLDDVNAYERFQVAVLETAAEQTQNDPAAIPFQNERIKSIFISSLDQSTMKKIAGQAIDGTYDWLEGESKSPVFSVDVRNNKEILANGVADYAVERLSALPPCTAQPAETNLFQLTCNPSAYYDAASIRSDIYRSVYADTALFPSETLGIDNLPKVDGENTIFAAYTDAPMYYKWFMWSPWILLGMAAFFSVLFVLLNRRKKAAIKSIGFALLSSGVILAITPFIYEYILPYFGLKLPSGDNAFAAISSDVANGMYGALNAMLINIAIQVAALGVIIIIISRFISKKPSPYKGIQTKAGVAVAQSSAPRNNTKISANQIPLQTSDAKYSARPTKNTKHLADKYRKL